MKLSERKEELKKEFELLQEKRTAILEQGKTLQQELSALDSEIVKLQGAYAEVEKLLAEDCDGSEECKKSKESKKSDK